MTKLRANLQTAFRLNENTVKCLYLINGTHEEILIEWNCIHHETGERGDYDLQLECLSSNENLNYRVVEAIKNGERDCNEDVEFYLDLRDSFDASNCESI